MGLGLPMAEYWTERMGGRLTITSDGSGRGTTVTVVIPMDTHHPLSESLELPSRQMYRITGCCSEAVPLQLQWLGCEEWDGQPLCADAPPILTVQDTTRCSQPQYDATIRTTFLDVGLRPQGSRPDDVESWSYLPKPVKPSSLLAVLRETAPAPEPWATTAPAMRLLVVDDNAVNRRLVKIHFEDWAIDEAENGQQGVRMAQSAVVPYHAILMDINMPVMDGYDATRAIRRLAPYKRTPILGISANAMSTDERWMECGMTAMHPKPVKWGALREAVLETVRQVSVTTDGSDSLMVPRTCADRKREPDSPRFSVAGHPHAPQFSDVISGAASGAGAASGHRSGGRTGTSSSGIGTSSSASSTALPSSFSVFPSTASRAFIASPSALIGSSSNTLSLQTSPSIMSGNRHGRPQYQNSTLFTALHSS